MKATVVIPTYNRASRLGELLGCLETQGPALARVVVGDDGSNDHTPGMVRAFEGRLPIVYTRQDNRGFRAGQARNLGIDRAVGDLIIFVDDDVLVAPDFVDAHIAAHAGASRARVALGYRCRAFDVPHAQPSAETILRSERDDRIEVLGAEGEGLPQHPTPWFFVYSCNFSVTRGQFGDPEAPGPRFDDAFVGWGMEDIEFGYRLHRMGYDLVPAPRAAVLHIEDAAPRDPFRCEVRSVEPVYDSYVQNSVYFMDKYPDDRALTEMIRADIRWYVRDETRGAWVKNGYANDVDAVIAHCRTERARRGGHVAHPAHAAGGSVDGPRHGGTTQNRAPQNSAGE
jgi:glycosyltransferase involved in cell wall biosynthesis